MNYIDQQGHASSHYYGLKQLVDAYRQTHFYTGNDYLSQHLFADTFSATMTTRTSSSLLANIKCRCMTFAQLTYRESLRDIEACLKATHMSIRSKVARSTLAEANEKRDWRIYVKPKQRSDFIHC